MGLERPRSHRSRTAAAVQMVVTALVLVGGSIWTIQAGEAAKRDRVVRAASLQRLLVSMTRDGASGAGIITVSIRATHTRVTRVIRSPRKTLRVRGGSGVTLTERPAPGAHWRFLEWQVDGDGSFEHAIRFGRYLRFRIVSAVKVRAEFIRVAPTATSLPAVTATPTTAASPEPTLTSTPLATTQPAVATVEPICRSWHPRPRCSFPTATPTDGVAVSGPPATGR